MTIDNLVRDFHHAMDIPVADKLGVPDEDRVRLRARLIAEEFLEVMEALFGDGVPLLGTVAKDLEDTIKQYALSVDLVELADGLCDLDYVVAGTRLEFGIPGEAVLAEVQRSNLSKVGGPVREDGKVMKGPNFSAPDIAGVLAKHGWSGK